ncbi:hypothetical protein COCNU_scaffold014613G000040 [Cocos nucifera]|nr:hypothetical protein [Cocos nucifera]
MVWGVPAGSGWSQYFIKIKDFETFGFGTLKGTKYSLSVVAQVIRFQQNMATYQNLITRSMYDKQLDSGKGTLLHLCDDVIQQEVKEVIISYFILMEQGKATIKDLDLRCEELIQEEFGMHCNFEVLDAVQKLEKLGIVARLVANQDILSGGMLSPSIAVPHVRYKTKSFLSLKLALLLTVE